jgi:hypothetical protein
MESKLYQSPRLVCYGPIADHTFNTPGEGDKSDNSDFEMDRFQELSHPPGS